MKKKENKDIDIKRKMSIVRPLNEGRFLSQEQEMLGDLFGSNPDNKILFGSKDSESLPRMDGFLFTGEGLINNGDVERRTGSFFGI